MISWSLLSQRHCVCSRVKYAGCDRDRSESQCRRGDSHRSDILQVISRHIAQLYHVDFVQTFSIIEDDFEMGQLKLRERKL